MKILLIHQYFLRPGEGGGSRFNEMTRFWREAGHEVTVIAGQIHYALDGKDEAYRGRHAVEEDQDGVRVLRAYTPSARHRSTLSRMVSFAGFGVGASLALLRYVREADVVIATSPSLMVLLPGLVARWLKRWPLIFEVRDLWPESAITTGVIGERSTIARALYLLERLGYASAQRINVLTPAFREDILRRGLAKPERIVYIPNGADVDLFTPGPADPSLRAALGWGERFVVLYTGAHGIANHLWQYIDAAERLKDREDILLVAIGDGPQKKALIEETRRRGLENLQWLDSVSKSEMPSIVRAADAGAAVLQRNPTFETVYPNKIFDYMACARPVLCAIDGIAHRLVVDEAKAGLFAEPENPDDLAARIIELAEDPTRRAEMGARGRRFVEENFARPLLAERYLRVLEAVASGQA